MSKTYQNICIRCGKARVVVRTWEEKLDFSTVTNTEMACPDPQCQKIVSQENNKQLQKYKRLKKKTEERLQKRVSDRRKKSAALAK